MHCKFYLVTIMGFQFGMTVPACIVDLCVYDLGALPS